MKRMIAAVVCLALLLPLCGCSSKSPPFSAPVRFYYCTDTTVDPRKGQIASEDRESAGFETDYTYILALYFQGPLDSELKSPFPRGTRLISIEVSDDAAQLDLSASFASLSGIDLSVSCACLALTVSSITGCDRVTIRAPGSLLDGSEAVTIIPSELILQDGRTDPT